MVIDNIFHFVHACTSSSGLSDKWEKILRRQHIKIIVSVCMLVVIQEIYLYISFCCFLLLKLLIMLFSSVVKPGILAEGGL